MSKPPFKTEYVIDYSSLTPDLCVSFPRLMLYVQETSLRHTDSTPFPMTWFVEQRKGWILTHWQVETLRMPCFNHKITISTWATYFKGFFAERAFEGRDEAGEVFLKAQSYWMFTNLNTRHPERPAPEMIEGYGENGEALLPKDIKITGTEGFEKVSSRPYRVTRRDLDTNYHANNVKYIEWAFDDVPQPIYENSFPESMKVAYKKECVEGDQLTIETYHRGDEYLFHILKNNGGDEEVLACEIYTVWREKQRGF